MASGFYFELSLLSETLGTSTFISPIVDASSHLYIESYPSIYPFVYLSVSLFLVVLLATFKVDLKGL